MQSNYDLPGLLQRLKPENEVAVYRRHKCLLHSVSDIATTDGKISYARVDADWWKRSEPEEILKVLYAEQL